MGKKKPTKTALIKLIASKGLQIGEAVRLTNGKKTTIIKTAAVSSP